MSDFGDRLRMARESRDFSLARLAQESGLSKAYLVRLEGAVDPNVGLLTVRRIADALGVAPHWLAFGRGGQKEGQK